MNEDSQPLVAIMTDERYSHCLIVWHVHVAVNKKRFNVFLFCKTVNFIHNGSASRDN